MYFNVFGQKTSRARWKAMLNAQKNRQELITARLGRRELFKLGLLTSAGYLVAKSGLSAWADGCDPGQCQLGCSPPTTPFIDPLPIMPVLPERQLTDPGLNPAPTICPNNATNPATGLPFEGRGQFNGVLRPGTDCFQFFNRFPPQKFFVERMRQNTNFRITSATSIPAQTIWGFNQGGTDPALSLVVVALAPGLLPAQTPVATVPVGEGPEGLTMAFDGATLSVWVANQFSNTVTKLRASDGAVLATVPVGNRPVAVTFSIASSGLVSIWVANNRSDTVTRLRALDGAVLGTFPVGQGPQGLAFDGSNIWVTNERDNTVTKLRASDGAKLGTFPVGKRPVGLAFDGSSIWVANQLSNTVTKLSAADGTNLGTFAVGNGPFAVAFAGGYIWVGNFFSKNVTKLLPTSGAVAGTYAVGDGPAGFASDGTYLWVANNGSSNVMKLDPNTGSVLATLSVGRSPFGVAFDGAHIWVASFGTNTVSRL